jgi:Putative Ig domain
MLVAVIAGCSGSPSPTNTTPPANLTYPQPAITATTGQPISTVTPSVMGAVTTYSVNPALPAGLNLNTTTGAITGTPTAAASQATYTITATNSAGSTTTTVQITVTVPILPPSNLVYPQTSIAIMVGQPIITDAPTVTGTVTAYSVAPALPSGLSLNTTTGAISGTPTAIAAQATYTITATNSAGNTTATVQIIVNAATPPPSSLTYPQSTIIASVGKPIPPYIPTVTGTVTSFSVAPALPAGLNFNITNGAITGIGTIVSAQANYIVTASNAGGSTTATLAITVTKALTALLDVGHANGIFQLRVSSTRVLSQDTGGHWALWDYASNTEIASGDQLPQPTLSTLNPWLIDMAGQIFIIGQSNGLDARATSDGHLLFEIQSPQIDSSTSIKSWWKLATDGSYICNGSPAGLTFWSSTGQQLFTRSGDYSTATAYASPGQVLVAGGPAGASVIETISASDGTSTTGPAFSGTFNSWFLDGQSFFTNTGTTVWIYAAATSAQQSLLSLPIIDNLTGQGNWFWTHSNSDYPTFPISIYPLGATAPVASFNTDIDTVAVPSANTIAILPYGLASASVIDLSGATPVKTDQPLPVAYESAYAAVSASQWIVGNTHGVLLDGTSASTMPRYFGTGQPWSIAGGANLVAIATANGNISYYSPSSSTTNLVGTINFSASKIAMSSDSTVLVAMANANDSQYEADRTLNVFSLPSGSLTYSIPYQVSVTPTLLDFSLSASGTVTGQILGTATTPPFTRQVAPTTGGAIIFSDNPSQSLPINLSPDGTLIAVSNSSESPSATTNIYKNGMIATAVNGVSIGWIDNNQLLVNNYTSFPDEAGYSNASIYNAAGTLSSSPTLPELRNILPVDSNSLYSPTLNTIFALPSGTTIYSSATPVTGPAAIAGSYVVFTSGSRIVVDTP